MWYRHHTVIDDGVHDVAFDDGGDEADDHDDDGGDGDNGHDDDRGGDGNDGVDNA